MAWLWGSYEQYANRIHPVYADGRGVFEHAAYQTLAQREASLNQARSEASHLHEELNKLLLASGKDEAPDVIQRAKRLADLLIHSCEEILLYHKRLAQTDHAYGFLSQHRIPEHYERYGTKRSMYEIGKLAKDVDDLLKGFHALESDDERFLDDMNVPDPQKADFQTARDLFSVGLDEAGVLLAARGLEGVLRAVAKKRKLEMGVKGRHVPAWEADLSDLVELFYRVTWKQTGERLITREFKALLHYLREIRNAGAHSGRVREAATILPRHVALLLATNSVGLWEKVTKSRATFANTIIDKNW